MKRAAVLLVMIGLLWTVSVAVDENAQVVKYHGWLMHSSGEPVPEGDYVFTFTIYSDEKDGEPLWRGELVVPVLDDGSYEINLGPISSDVFYSSDAPQVLMKRWLEVQPAGWEPLEPRTAIQGPPCATAACLLDYAKVSNDVPPYLDTLGDTLSVSKRVEKLTKDIAELKKLIEMEP